jgi:cell division protein FtsL
MAALLAGIVALNVGVLRLNMEGERLDEEYNQLETRHRQLEADFSSKADLGRIEGIALHRLGLVRAEDRTYFHLLPPKKG